MTQVPTARLVDRIVSGGQTGVDRGALDAALHLGIPHGGWCPRGRLAEDGPIAAHYHLRETASAHYAVRTRQNVLDSSATLIICRGALRGGTRLTHQLAHRYNKSTMVVDVSQQVDLELIRQWLSQQQVRILNVAGPRESTAPGIAAETFDLLVRLLSRAC